MRGTSHPDICILWCMPALPGESAESAVNRFARDEWPGQSRIIRKWVGDRFAFEGGVRWYRVELKGGYYTVYQTYKPVGEKE